MKNKERYLIILLIIIIIAALVIGYYYQHQGNLNINNNANKAVEENEYTFSFKVGSYIIEENSDKKYRFKDINGNIVYQGTTSYYSFLYEYNDNLYYYDTDKQDDMFKLIIKKLDNGIFKEYKIIEINTADYLDASLVYYQENAIGFMISQSLYDRTYYDLEGNKYEISIKGDYVTQTLEDKQTTNSDKFISIQKNEKVGLYNYIDKKIVIDYIYDDLMTTNYDMFVANKNGRDGIIDSNNNILLPFEYDYIGYEDDYFEVVKDKKMALMDKDLKFITGFDFEAINHTYKRRGGAVQLYFESYKKDDLYYITTHPDENNFEITKSYVVDKTGKIIQ